MSDLRARAERQWSELSQTITPLLHAHNQVEAQLRRQPTKEEIEAASMVWIQREYGDLAGDHLLRQVIQRAFEGGARWDWQARQ